MPSLLQAVGRLVPLLVLVALAAPVPGMELSGRVVHVAAGDRLKVDTGRGVVAVRLAHVRAPARAHFYWPRARRALGELVFGRRVRLVAATAGAAAPLPARVLVDGVDVAALLVERGLLLAAGDAPAALRRREAEARRGERGIWGSGVPPRDGR